MLLLVGDHGQCRGSRHRLARAHHGVVLEVEVLPAEVDPARGGSGDGLPGLALVALGALPVHVDEDGQVIVPGIELTLAAGGKLAILTQGPTPLDRLASVRMSGDVVVELDAVMVALELAF